MESDPETLYGRRFWLSALGISAVAAAIRWPALGTDFWLDEIWSWEHVQSYVRSFGDVFSRPELKHDNNHHLNTLWIYLVGDQQGWLAYRMLAFLCGVGSVLLAVALGWRRHRWTGVLSGILFAGSFVMVIYSTEARGYGPAVFFALAAFLALDLYLARRSPPWAVLFWCSVVLGFLAHFVFAHFYLGAVLWSAHRFFHVNRVWRDLLVPMAWLHVVPLLYASTIYFLVVRSMQIGGGDPWQWQQVLSEALAWTLGMPLMGGPAIAVLIGLGIALIWDGLHLHREGSDEWVLSLVVVVLAPALTLAVLTPDYLYARYFILPLTFLLLALGRCLARMAGRSRGGAISAAVLVVLFLVGNGIHLWPFWQHGRGLARQAVRDMQAESAAGERSVAIDHDLRIKMPLDYYQRRQPASERLRPLPRRILEQGVDLPGGVEWVIFHTQEHRPKPPGIVRLPLGAYRLYKHYPCYGPSGMHWFVYRRDR